MKFVLLGIAVVMVAINQILLAKRQREICQELQRLRQQQRQLKRNKVNAK